MREVRCNVTLELYVYANPLRVQSAFVEANYDHVFWKSRGSHDIVEDGVKIRVDYASDDRRPGEARPRKREYGKSLQFRRFSTMVDTS